MSFFLVAHHANGQVMVIAFICSFKFVLEICTLCSGIGESLKIFFISILSPFEITFKALEKGRQKYETKHTRLPNLRTGTLSFHMPY